MYRVFIKGTTTLLQEEKTLEKAIRYAELYEKNFGGKCTIQKCEVVWSN